ncbi:MAG: gamma-glutamyltransferase [Gammaproteobacteria bacterium]
MNKLVSILLVFCITVPAVFAADHRPGKAAIASAHPLATQAGLEIIERGGNAFDAAVAVSAALSVVEQYSSGLGGGGFWLLHRASDDFEVLVDGREVAPSAATVDMYLDGKGNVVPGRSREGPLSAGIPGTVAGLAHISETYGRLSLAEALAPAIALAQDGFPVFDRMRQALTVKKPVLSRWEAGSVLYYPNGQMPEEGALFRQPDLARTLERVARLGRDGFYRGETASLLVSAVRDHGGIWSETDLAEYEVREREPIVGHYKGVRIVSCPLPSAGGIGLVNMLNILSGYDLGPLDSASRIHLTVEAMRRAFRDRSQYLGDPDFIDAPVDRLVHPFYAAGQRASIRTDRATPSASLPDYMGEVNEGNDTTHFSILDAEGNRVAGTQTVNGWFGSGFVAQGTGLILNNEMDDFSIKPGVENIYRLVGSDANEVRPGKRMLSSMTPTFLESDRGIAILGTPGGSRIITMVLLSSLAWMDGADAAQMVALPRYHHQFLPDEIKFEEDALTEEEILALQAMGHTLNRMNRRYGFMNAITWDFASGKVMSASDPRNAIGVAFRIY